MRTTSIALVALFVFAVACGGTSTSDAGVSRDAGAGADAATPADSGRADSGADGGTNGVDGGEAHDAGGDEDAGDDQDAGTTDLDAGSERGNLLPQFCPSTPTAPGLYSGTLALNTNDIASADCLGSTPGRDGAVRLELAPGQTVRAVYRHDGDGILYVLDRCPVVTIDSCLDSSDESFSGPETVEWTNDGAEMNTVYVVLDSDALDGPQTFELDLFVTGP